MVEVTVFQLEGALDYTRLGITCVSILVSLPWLLFVLYLALYHIWLNMNNKSTYSHILEKRQREIEMKKDQLLRKQHSLG